MALLPPKPDVASEEPLRYAGQRWSGELARIGWDFLAWACAVGAVRMAMIGDFGRAEGEDRDCSSLVDSPEHQLQAHVTGSPGFGGNRKLLRLLGSAAGALGGGERLRAAPGELAEPNSGGIRTNLIFCTEKGFFTG